MLVGVTVIVIADLGLCDCGLKRSLFFQSAIANPKSEIPFSFWPLDDEDVLE